MAILISGDEMTAGGEGPRLMPREAGRAMPNDSSLYETDFFLWTEQQAADLRRAAREGSNVPLDYENLAEEIESLGRSEKREVESLVSNILEHLLKLACSPASGPRPKWRGETGRFRRQLAKALRDSPSLKARLEQIVADEWKDAVECVERNLEDYGELSQSGPLLAIRKLSGPPSVEQILDQDFFWPAPPNPL